jgi:hypothetical protein
VRLLKDELEARGINNKESTSASRRRIGGKPFSRRALYPILQNRTFAGLRQSEVDQRRGR